MSDEPLIGRQGGKQRGYDDMKLAALFLGDEVVVVVYDDEGRELGFGHELPGRDT